MATVANLVVLVAPVAREMRHTRSARVMRRLRAFVATEIPTIDAHAAWTPEQVDALARLYRSYRHERAWYCWRARCGVEVARYGDQCARCRAAYGDPGPVDWAWIMGAV